MHEFLSHFGQDPDKEAMSMQDKSVLSFFKELIILRLNKKPDDHSSLIKNHSKHVLDSEEQQLL